jgi:hypothetical protein
MVAAGSSGKGRVKIKDFKCRDTNLMQSVNVTLKEGRDRPLITASEVVSLDRRLIVSTSLDKVCRLPQISRRPASSCEIVLV